MSKFRPWAFWRRLQYGGGFLLFWFIIGGVIYFNNQTPPTCTDGLQNGTETGIDCGGSCLRICTADVVPPKVVWAESFKIIDGQYNAVAYIENLNPIAATRELKYRFKLLERGSVIAERSGVTVLPPASVYSIFEGRINTESGREPTETVFEIEPEAFWLPAAAPEKQFNVIATELTGVDTRPRLIASIENTALTVAPRVEIVATIFDSVGKPLTASQTFVDNFAPRSRLSAIFTWPNSIAKTVRSCEIPSDIMLVLDRSGSMAAEGGEPPEPLQSAKEAAQRFISQIKNNDQIGVLSYATTPSNPLEQVLTTNKEVATAAVEAVTMGKEGTQYTNMGDAFKAAQAELLSERHRDNARKVIIFLTDGDVTRPVNPATGEADREYAAGYAREAAAAAKEQNTTIYSIGFGDFFSTTSTDSSEVNRDINLLRDLASTPEQSFTAPTIADLERVYREIATGICEEGPAKIDILPKTGANFLDQNS